MVDSKENYKFDLGVKGLIGMANKTSVNYNNNSLSMHTNHNEAWYELIHLVLM